jgi:hypothetical protein
MNRDRKRMSQSFILALVVVMTGTFAQLRAQTPTNTFPQTGNVGIGTTSPNALLEIKGTDNQLVLASSGNRGLELGTDGTTATVLAYDRAGSGTYKYLNLNAAQHLFSISGAEKMRIDSSGNVGIGVTSPAAKLHLDGGGAIIGTTGGGSGPRTLTILNSGQNQVNYGSYPYEWSPALQLQNNDNSKFVWLSAGGSGSYSSYNARLYTRGSGLDFFTGEPGSELFAATIASNGNVGIGAANPGTHLHVTSAVAGPQIGAYSTATSGSNYGIDAGATGGGAAVNVGGFFQAANGNANKGVYISGVSSGANNYALYSDAAAQSYFAGSVGIGTAIPSTKFNVSGGQFLVNGASSYPQVKLSPSSGHSIIDIERASASTGETGIRFVTAGGTINYEVYVPPNSGDLRFYSAGDKVTFGANGNVGIGVTEPNERLEVSGNIKLTGTGNINATGTIEAGNIKAKYQDVAEWVPSSEQLSAGTVVVLDSTKSNQVTSSSVSYDTRVAGVVSEQPGIALGEKSDSKVLVATTGRVRVKVDATKGPIHIGDLLVTSDVPGIAMKSEAVNLGGVQFHRPGTLIGKALEPLEKGKGEILVLLSLQ